MPQLTLTDGELLKKTLRTTLVMLGSTALWLGALTGAVVMTTGPSGASPAESKAEKVPGSSPLAAPNGVGKPVMAGGKPHRTIPVPGKTDLPHTGDPIEVSLTSRCRYVSGAPGSTRHQTASSKQQ